VRGEQLPQRKEKKLLPVTVSLIRTRCQNTEISLVSNALSSTFSNSYILNEEIKNIKMRGYVNMISALTGAAAEGACGRYEGSSLSE